MSNITEKKIVIASHIHSTGPAHDLRDYLIIKKTKSVLFIGHPLFYKKGVKGSNYELYKDSILTETKSIKSTNKILLVNYIKELLLNIIWPIKNVGEIDIYIGVDNLNTLAGLILKFLGRTNKVIYYVIDYNPKRFKNIYLNKLYHYIDQLCVKYSDETWNVSPRMKIARENYFGFKSENQKIVPIGIWLNRIKVNDFYKIDRHKLVFMGHILEKQGIQYVLNSIPLIVESITDFKFLIIGDGDYLQTLREQSHSLSISKYVTFTGYVESHEDIEKMLSECSLSIALYDKYEKNGDYTFTYFADPAKIKSYLAAGLPVLLSDVAYNAKEIEEKKCGFIIVNNPLTIKKSIISILQNEEKLKLYRENCLNLAKEFDWNFIFRKALNLN